MTYVITEPCVDVHDRGCVDECPVDCIYDGVRKGDIEKEFFGPAVTGLGAPGGAEHVGSAGLDHPVVAAVPVSLP
jgi:ferredoxin